MNRLEIGSVVLGRLKSDDAWALFGKTNESGASPENRSSNTTEALPGVEQCGEGIWISNQKLALELDIWDCCVVVRYGACELDASVTD